MEEIEKFSKWFDVGICVPCILRLRRQYRAKIVSRKGAKNNHAEFH